MSDKEELVEAGYAALDGNLIIKVLVDTLLALRSANLRSAQIGHLALLPKTEATSGEMNRLIDEALKADDTIVTSIEQLFKEAGITGHPPLRG